jgi:hypothetical protein
LSDHFTDGGADLPGHIWAPSFWQVPDGRCHIAINKHLHYSSPGFVSALIRPVSRCHSATSRRQASTPAVLVR